MSQPNHFHVLRSCRPFWRGVAALAVMVMLPGCGIFSGGGNMGGPDPATRAAKIAGEPRGDFHYGRRYVVKYTRFWGYLRAPGQPAEQARLVVFNESRRLAPDRMPEDGPPGNCFGFDQNFEYRIHGYYTGREVYDNHSNRVLPEFMLLDYRLLERDPGWLFSPADYYDPWRLTLEPGGGGWFRRVFRVANGG